jgi:hypothetical protein
MRTIIAAALALAGAGPAVAAMHNGTHIMMLHNDTHLRIGSGQNSGQAGAGAGKVQVPSLTIGKPRVWRLAPRPRP